MEREYQSIKTSDQIDERVDELQRKKEEKQKIIDDENTSTSERAAAEERVAEIDEELARTRTNVVEMGVTLGSIILVASLKIGAVSLAATNALKTTAKTLVNGLKEVGQKKSLPSSPLRRLDCFFPLQNCRADRRFSGGAHLAADFGCGGIPKVYQKEEGVGRVTP